jgi:multiple sugar transport system permease protein
VSTASVKPQAVAIYGILVIAALVVAVPLVWIAEAAFRTQISLLTGQVLFQPTLAAFQQVLFSSTSDFLMNYRSSFIVGLLSTALCVLAGTLAAWSLERLDWPGWVRHLFLGWALVFQMIPPVALASAWFTMERAVHLDNTFAGLILAHATLNLPMAVWLMSVFTRDVPQELVEAARIDGADGATLFWRIVVPIIAPGLAATTVLCFVFSWNEFAVALNLTGRETATVPVAISKFAQDFQIQYTQMAAAASLSILPALVLLLIGQRYIVRGLTTGALK